MDLDITVIAMGWNYPRRAAAGRLPGREAGGVSNYTEMSSDFYGTSYRLKRSRAFLVWPVWDLYVNGAYRSTHRSLETGKRAAALLVNREAASDA